MYGHILIWHGINLQTISLTISIVEECLCSISDWLETSDNRTVLFGGDLNVDLEKHDAVCDLVNRLCSDNCLHRCDSVPVQGNDIRRCTYFNESLSHETVIDYFLISNTNLVSEYEVIDNDYKPSATQGWPDPHPTLAEDTHTQLSHRFPY